MLRPPRDPAPSWPARVALATLFLAAGCRCGDAPPGPPDGVPVMVGPHYAELERLVDLAIRGRTDEAHVVARDLDAGTDEGSADLGSALGFLQLAEGEELADGVAAVAVACGACHSAASVPVPEAPGGWEHRTAAWLLVEGAVWNRNPTPRERDTDLRRAWEAAEGLEAQLAAGLAVCQACHAGAPPVDPAVVEARCGQPCMGSIALYRRPDAPIREIDRLVASGDRSKCSHVMSRWLEADGTEVHAASDKPRTKEWLDAFHAEVDAFMGDRIVATEVECPAGAPPAGEAMR